MDFIDVHHPEPNPVLTFSPPPKAGMTIQLVPRTQLEAAPGATQCNALIILRICAFFQ